MDGVLVYRASREIVKREDYPEISGLPIPGFGLNDTGMYEWLIVRNIDLTPVRYEYDPRYLSLFTEENKAAGVEHPNYPGVGAFTITNSLVPTSVAERLNALESAENNANSTLMPTTKQLKHIVIALNALRKLIQGITLATYETTVLTRVAQYANKIASNYAVAKQKQTLIENNEQPDLDADWINE